MNKITLSAFAVIAAFGTASIACSSAPSDPVDADSTLESFKNPTGSFSKDNAGSAFSGYKSEQNESGKVSRPGGVGGTSSTQSIKLLTRTLDAKAQCAEGQPCACPVSGTFTYKLEQSKSGQALRASFDKCIDQDNTGFDGELLFLATNKPLLDLAKKAPIAKKLRSGSTPKLPTGAAPPSGGSQTGSEGGLTEASPDAPSASSGGENFLLAARGSAIEAQRSTPIEFAIVKEAGYLVAAVSVADGKIIVGMGPDGSIFVQAKQGSWVCSPKGSRYTCEGDGQVQDLEVDDAPSAEPSAPSASADPTGGASGGSADDLDL